MFADLTDARRARPVAAALVASGAFTVDMRLPRDQWFRWKSGIVAPCGCNCRRLNTLPAIRRLIDGQLTAQGHHVHALDVRDLPPAALLAADTTPRHRHRGRAL